ncbi:DUF2793 domain-containing protein [Phaeobacter sp. NW0010-22]|uniref:DUF2793 domain-containing protein n=1 Tax=Phaeobacter sp. NW0010-22 TaxID=3135907 RepID=UPI00310808D7
MPDTSPRLGLPYLQPSQAQKHVTHNEALQQLDMLVQLTVLAMAAETPPGDPAAGDVHALGAAPTAAWAGQEGKLALWTGSGWQFIEPQNGWRTYDLGSQRAYVFTGGAWQPETDTLQNVAQVGIATTADATNRLAIASEASLFSHAGAGHQLKVNKAAVGDTASLLFQSNWTGHAEMGLAGDTAFTVKTSANGSTWTESLRVDPVNEEIALAPSSGVKARLTDSALQLDVPLTGNAVQTDAQDTTSGRVLKVGSFGLGSALPDLNGDLFADANKTGFYFARPSASSGASDMPSDGDWHVLKSARQAGQAVALAVPQDNAQDAALWWVTQQGGTVGNWRRAIDTGNLVGTVAGTGSVPTGAAFEHGSNANGYYTRYADGTQICWRRNWSIGPGSATWNFPAAFLGGQGTVTVIGTSTSVAVDRSVTGLSSSYQDATIRVWDKDGVGTTAGVSLIAIGRWI